MAKGCSSKDGMYDFYFWICPAGTKEGKERLHGFGSIYVRARDLEAAVMAIKNVDPAVDLTQVVEEVSRGRTEGVQFILNVVTGAKIKRNLVRAESQTWNNDDDGIIKREYKITDRGLVNILQESEPIINLIAMLERKGD